LFGTVHGCIGVITTVSEDLFKFLTAVQGQLSKIIKSVGNIDHELYPFTQELIRYFCTKLMCVIQFLFTVLEANHVMY